VDSDPVLFVWLMVAPFELLCNINLVLTYPAVAETHWKAGNVRLILVFVMGLWVLTVALAQNQDTVNGDWLLTRDAYGNPLYHKMTLHLENGKLTGTFWDDKLEGTLDGDALDFVARDEKGNTAEVTGTLNLNTITGKVVEVDAAIRRTRPRIQ
jgi:hypothetical protein